MKNVFKKIAFVLALAMAITIVAPAASASAATAPSFKKVGKILYVGGDQSGTIKSTYRYYFNNAAGYTATWKSSNAKVAKVNASTGVITAVAPGTAEIVATLTNKKTGSVVELTNKVWVKQNAEEVGFGSLKATEDVKVGDKFKVNVYRAVNGTKVWTQNDVATVTDTIVWSSSNTEVATVDKYGTVKVVGAGECTITAKAVQKEGSYVSASKSYSFAVAEGITNVKLNSSTQVEVTFGSPVTDAVAQTLTMKNSKGVNVTSYIKKITLNEAGTVATVDTYVKFVDGETYTFAVESLDTTFELASKIGSAASVVITSPEQVVVGTQAAIEYKVYDENGIEIEVSNPTVTYELSDYTYASLNNGYVSMYKAGATTVLTMTFHTGKYDENWKEITFTATKVIKCVEDTGAAIKGDVTYAVTNTATPTDAQFAKGNKVVAMEQTGMFLNVTAKDTEGNKVTGFKFESLDSTKLLVNQTTGALIPVATGTVAVRVTKGDDFTTIVYVTVGAKIAASSVSVSNSGTTTLSNSNTVNETVKFTLTVLDQYNNKMSASAIAVESVQRPATVEKTEAEGYLVDNNDSTATFSAANVTAGAYTYKLTTRDKSVYVTVTVKKPATTVASYKVIVNNTEIDTTIEKDADLANDFNTDFTVVGVDANGVAVNVATTAAIVVKNSAGKVIFSDLAGTSVNVTDTVSDLAVTGTQGAYNFETLVSTGSAINTNTTKLPAGVYTITGTVGTRTIAPATITVKDAQATPSVTVKNTTLSYSLNGSSDLYNDLTALFEAPTATTTSSYVLSAIVAGDVETTFVDTTTAGTYHALVKTLVITETITNTDSSTTTINHEVALNRVVTVTVK